MNDNEIHRQIDREVSNRGGLIALMVCMGVIVGVLIAGGIVLLRQLG